MMFSSLCGRMNQWVSGPATRGRCWADWLRKSTTSRAIGGNSRRERGKTNLAWALNTPHRFFSLAHELATAFFFDAREGVWVEPLFFDPKATSGKPDIVVHTPKRDFAIQCKSQDPTSARQFPYDLWQYFAGVYHRVVQDSGRSIHFSAVLKSRLNEKQIRKLARRVSGLVRKGLSTPYPLEVQPRYISVDGPWGVSQGARIGPAQSFNPFPSGSLIP